MNGGVCTALSILQFKEKFIVNLLCIIHHTLANM